ncbi:hypothetical protein [Corallococcus sp. Z5C101001]|uniref:hypothetical protein n=1 Tax=Corallococcus sp. Z5C101001 TaxID=2596829 RepID=UPI00117DF633|nr:hypothetical protein [Corallococcus sp. Z5C101001]TSC34247.1 hypothetical protein FOF48_04215 [Corallococcus sp. Z5C101001]
MSNTADIVDGITRLVSAVDALLQTDTVKALTDLVRSLGIGGYVKTGLQAIGKVLDLITGWLSRLEQVAAIPLLLEKLEPAFDGLRAIGETSGEEMREMGMDALAPLAGAAHSALLVLEKVRAGVATVIQGYLPAESLKALRESVESVAATLEELESAVVVAPPAKAKLQLAGGTT